MNNLEDFGHRIDGAKKFRERITSAKGYTGLTKRQLWKLDLNNELDRYSRFLLTKFYQAIRQKPNNSLPSEEFEDILLRFKEEADQVKTEEDALDFIKSYTDPYIIGAEYSSVFYKKLYPWNLTKSQMEKENFDLSEDEIALKTFGEEDRLFRINSAFRINNRAQLVIERRQKKIVYDLSPSVQKNSLEDGKFLLIENKQVKLINIDLTEYQIYLDSKLEMLRKKKKNKHKATFKHIENLTQSGFNYRDGEDITPEIFQEYFSLYGVQYGNYLSNKDRIFYLNSTFDAFLNLAIVLQIDPKSIGFNQTLGLSFGARGYGKAEAHYELERQVINLTKFHGPGSLAHEWFHALDHYLSILYGNSKELYSNHYQRFQSLNRLLDEMNNVKTNFRMNSLALDTTEKRKKEYWATKSEMLARAFTAFIIDRLEDRGIRDDFLCYEFELREEPKFAMFPQGKERQNLNNLFDLFFDELRHNKVLKPRENQNFFLLSKHNKQERFKF